MTRPLYDNGKMLKCFLFPKCESHHANYFTAVLSGHSRRAICKFDPMTSPSGHSNHMRSNAFFASSFSENRDRTVELILGPNAFLSPRRIYWSATWSTWVAMWPHMTLTWSQILTNFLGWQWNMHIFRGVSTRGARLLPNYVTSFLT